MSEVVLEMLGFKGWIRYCSESMSQSRIKGNGEKDEEQ
jgi:hypothetical protein